MIRISFLLPFECLNGFSYCWWWWFVFRMLTAEAMCCYYWCYSIVPSDRHIIHTHTQVVPQRRNGPVQRMEKEWIKCSFTIYYSNDRWWQEFDIKQILILYGIIDCIANANANAKRVNMTTIKSRCMAFHFMLFYSTSVHFCVCVCVLQLLVDMHHLFCFKYKTYTRLFHVRTADIRTLSVVRDKRSRVSTYVLRWLYMMLKEKKISFFFTQRWEREKNHTVNF